VTADLFSSPASASCVCPDHVERLLADVPEVVLQMLGLSHQCTAGLDAILTGYLVDTFTDILWSVLVFGMYRQTRY